MRTLEPKKDIPPQLKTSETVSLINHVQNISVLYYLKYFRHIEINNCENMHLTTRTYRNIINHEARMQLKLWTKSTKTYSWWTLIGVIWSLIHPLTAYDIGKFFCKILQKWRSNHWKTLMTKSSTYVVHSESDSCVVLHKRYEKTNKLFLKHRF